MRPITLIPVALLAALFIAPPAPAAGNGALDRAFNKADINHDGVLDSTEFLALQSRRKSRTDTIHRFNLADVDHDSQLSPVEFRASNGGKEGKKPSKTQTFVLADLDDDGFLNPDEFASTQPQVRPWRKILRDFGRKDRDDDSLLSPREFGIRGSLSL